MRPAPSGCRPIDEVGEASSTIRCTTVPLAQDCSACSGSCGCMGKPRQEPGVAATSRSCSWSAATTRSGARAASTGSPTAYRTRSGLTDVTTLVYPDARHEIFNEVSQEKVRGRSARLARQRGSPPATERPLARATASSPTLHDTLDVGALSRHPGDQRRRMGALPRTDRCMIHARIDARDGRRRPKERHDMNIRSARRGIAARRGARRRGVVAARLTAFSRRAGGRTRRPRRLGSLSSTPTARPSRPRSHCSGQARDDAQLLGSIPSADWFTKGTPAEVQAAVDEVVDAAACRGRDARARGLQPARTATARSTPRAAPPTPRPTRRGSTASPPASATARRR